ncbi:hypothetical protein CEXT_163961 [Caerostris extrusa]|uniref:Uncharacterized protein n=1 Tax=Caerostris extrusa TaxID=172846 RepID=A0AAV4SYH0_CAEEX|nr:hypothetical protein CEXT_163961 [Caerostris extrusa]
MMRVVCSKMPSSWLDARSTSHTNQFYKRSPSARTDYEGGNEDVSSTNPPGYNQSKLEMRVNHKGRGVGSHRLDARSISHTNQFYGEDCYSSSARRDSEVENEDISSTNPRAITQRQVMRGGFTLSGLNRSALTGTGSTVQWKKMNELSRY